MAAFMSGFGVTGRRRAWRSAYVPTNRCSPSWRSAGSATRIVRSFSAADSVPAVPVGPTRITNGCPGGSVPAHAATTPACWSAAGSIHGFGDPVPYQAAAPGRATAAAARTATRPPAAAPARSATDVATHPTTWAMATSPGTTTRSSRKRCGGRASVTAP